MTASSHHPATEPKWRRLPEERPHQIMDAAIEVFGERGLSSARLEDVAKRAGISKGTIYLYFPNKVALFQEMVRQTVGAQIDRVEQELARHTGTAIEQIDAYIRAWWQFNLSPHTQTISRLLISELPRFPELAQFYADEVVVRKVRLLSALIARGVESGAFRPVDPESTARLLGAMMYSYGTWCGMRNLIPALQRFSDDEIREQIRDFFFHAVAPVSTT
ncbi:MAG TPA: TetR/AcrR family transcriptional regulator [Gemmatimonadaceae bacterium]|jgi:AcrR family transcriptional regulator|nr:TetR/AcrR family transcriptional regulator [Gemmatimonadaceae bacterium]